MPIHPEVLWAQRSSEIEEEKNVLYLTVNLTDVIPDSLKLELKPTSISFEARAGDNAKGIEEKEYAFHFDLFKEIVPEKSKQKLTSRHLALTLQKAEKAAEYWPRLTKEKLKTPFLKTDFSRWVDEDEQDGAPAAAEEDEMGGMGDMAGMGGMGGMGGMPGMGGMGGMPGMGGMGGGPGGMGGMDLQKMLAEMNASGAGGGGEPSGSGVAGEEEEGDSDDDGPPPLEDAPAVSSSS